MTDKEPTASAIIDTWIQLTGKSMSELARRMGSGGQSVSLWRSGKVKPSAATMRNLLRAVTELKYSEEKINLIVSEYMEYKGKHLNTRSTMLVHIKRLEERIDKLEKLLTPKL